MTEWHPLRPYDNDDNHCDSHDDDDDDRNNDNNKEEWKQLNKSAVDRGRSMLTLAAKMPTLNHSSMNDYQHVYEPSDDTYLLVDAIKYDLQFDDDDDDDDDDKRDHNGDVNDDEKEKEMINNIAIEIYHQQHQQEIIHRDNDNIKTETCITAVHGRLHDILHNVYEERIKDDIVKKVGIYYLNQNQNQLTYYYDKILRKLKQLKRLDEIDSVMELGTGSGIPITYLTKRLLMEKQSKPVVFLADDDDDGTNNNDTIRMNCKSNDNSNDNDNDNKGLSVIATDLNPFALKFAQRTAEENGIIVIKNTNNNTNKNNNNNVYIQSIEFVECNLAQPLLNRLQNKVDVILFNPPYVPTEDDEIHGKGIEISWAGGVNGRRIIDHSLSQIATLLRKPYGICYLITVDDNLPLELALKLKNQYHLQMIPLLRRRARNEYLTVQKITWM